MPRRGVQRNIMNKNSNHTHKYQGVSYSSLTDFNTFRLKRQSAFLPTPQLNHSVNHISHRRNLESWPKVIYLYQEFQLPVIKKMYLTSTALRHLRIKRNDGHRGSSSLTNVQGPVCWAPPGTFLGVKLPLGLSARQRQQAAGRVHSFKNISEHFLRARCYSGSWVHGSTQDKVPALAELTFLRGTVT